MSEFVTAVVPQQAVHVVLKKSWDGLLDWRGGLQPRYSPALGPVHENFSFKGILPESSVEWPSPHADMSEAKKLSVQMAGLTSACVRLSLQQKSALHVAAGEPVFWNFKTCELELGIGPDFEQVAKVVEFIGFLDSTRWPPRAGGVDSVGLSVGQMAHLVIKLQPTRVQHGYEDYQKEKVALEYGIMIVKKRIEKINKLEKAYAEILKSWEEADSKTKKKLRNKLEFITKKDDLITKYTNQFITGITPEPKIDQSPPSTNKDYNNQFIDLNAYYKAILKYYNLTLLPQLKRYKTELTKLETMYNPDI